MTFEEAQTEVDWACRGLNTIAAENGHATIDGKTLGEMAASLKTRTGRPVILLLHPTPGGGYRVVGYPLLD
ncbi:MAG TPA: hypothetical protein VLT47_11060 [Anaeromyxobacteraceae bacterium]|nr:hypothetical protein [Anaeromyxobacteraceae bacterium]